MPLSQERASVLGRVDGFDQDGAAGEGDDGGVVLGRPLAAQGDALEALELADGLLDPGAASVKGLGEGGGPVLGIAPAGDGRADAALAGRLAVGLGVAALAGRHRPRRDVGADAEQGLELAGVAGLAAGEVGVERQALGVALQVDLGPEPAARAAERPALPPPFAPAAETCARTAVLSNIRTRHAVRLSPASAWEKAPNTPARLGRRKRFRTLFRLPDPAGSARQAALWTVRWCSASRKRRSSRPLSPRRDRAARNTASATAQSRSVIRVSIARPSQTDTPGITDRAVRESEQDSTPWNPSTRPSITAAFLRTKRVAPIWSGVSRRAVHR